MIETERSLPSPRCMQRLALAACIVVLTACASPRHQAPVEGRDVMRDGATATTEDPSKLPGAENAGRPGYYTVKPGDTIMRISLETGQYWKDLIQWNPQLPNPNVLVVGQVVRVTPPEVTAEPATSGDPSMVVATAPIGESRVEARPLDSRPPAAGAVRPPVVAPVSPPASTSNTTTATSGAMTGSGAAAAPTDPDSNLGWIWPSSGPVIARFDDARNKGISIGGKAGDPVVAAADGRVVYAGSGLRGYGNLVIVKHNNTYLTAYAHNQMLLVKEDQAVSRGQRIAEMGSTDAEQVKLHFEIRRQGRPVDPTKYLPAR